MPAPWNQIRSKEYPSPCIPVLQLWHNFWNLSYAIPLGLAPWNLYSAHNGTTNIHTKTECFNTLKPDSTVPLGSCQLNIAFTFEL